MSEVVTAAPAPPVVRLPPAVRGPKLFQGLAFVVSRRRLLGRFVRRYGKAFTANILMYGRVVVVADPQLARQVFTSSPEELGNIQPNLSRMFGSGSVFALDGDDHRRRRRLLAPPFHGKSMKNYETIIEEETLRETANWPQGQAFATLPSMMHITLNAILRAIFGAGGSELDEPFRRGSRWARAWRRYRNPNATMAALARGAGWPSGGASTTLSSTSSSKPSGPTRTSPIGPTYWR